MCGWSVRLVRGVSICLEGQLVPGQYRVVRCVGGGLGRALLCGPACGPLWRARRLAPVAAPVCRVPCVCFLGQVRMGSVCGSAPDRGKNRWDMTDIQTVGQAQYGAWVKVATSRDIACSCAWRIAANCRPTGLTTAKEIFCQNLSASFVRAHPRLLPKANFKSRKASLRASGPKPPQGVRTKGMKEHPFDLHLSR